MGKRFLLFVLFLSILVLSGCVNEPDKEQSTTQVQITDEQKQLNSLLQDIETLINKQSNYTLSTSVEVRLYSSKDAIPFTENIVNITEKFDFEQQSQEYGYYQKVGYDKIEEGKEAYKIVDDRLISFQFSDGVSSVDKITPYGGNFSNEALMNLKLLMKNLSQSAVTIDNEGRLVVEQSLSSVIDNLKREKFYQIGLTNSVLDITFELIFEYDTETNELKISVQKDNIPSNGMVGHHADLKYEMTLKDYGSTEIISSVIDYDGKVGSNAESVLLFSNIESLFTILHTNFYNYKVRVEKPSIYRVEWVSGQRRPYIDFVNKYDSTIQMHKWIDNEAIYFEPGDYAIIVNDPFRLIKDDYSKHTDYQIDYSQLFTYQPQGKYDFTRLYIHTDVYNDQEYVKIKINDNGRIYGSYLEKKYQITQGEDGYYYTNGDLFYLMSSDGNPVTVEITYLEIHEKDQAPIISTTYSDYYFSNSKYRDFITYHVLKVNQSGDYMISANFLGNNPSASMVITNQYGDLLFEGENHPIVNLDPGMYYVYMIIDKDFFYQIKYTNISEFE